MLRMRVSIQVNFKVTSKNTVCLEQGQDGEGERNQRRTDGRGCRHRETLRWSKYLICIVWPKGADLNVTNELHRDKITALGWKAEMSEEHAGCPFKSASQIHSE